MKSMNVIFPLIPYTEYNIWCFVSGSAHVCEYYKRTNSALTPEWGDLYVSTYGVQDCMKKYGVLIEEISLGDKNNRQGSTISTAL